MEINNQVGTSQQITQEKPLELKQGEIYKATIKERISDNEALIQIRGREIQVKFEGEIPPQDRVTVQVKGQTDQHLHVKIISETSKGTVASPSQTETASIQSALRNLGIVNPSHELRQAVQIVLDKDIPLTQKSAQDLQNFIEKEMGTVEQRLNTVQAIANKRLEITTNHLRSVHEALNGPPLNEVLSNIAKELNANSEVSRHHTEHNSISKQNQDVREQVQSSLEQIRSEVAKSQRIEQAIVQQGQREITQGQISQSSVSAQVASEQINQTIETSEHTIKNDQLNPTDLLKVMQSTVQKEGDFQKAITLLVNQVANAPFDVQSIQQLQKAIGVAVHLEEEGRELAARQQLMNAFADVERSVAKLDQIIQPEIQQYMINEVFQKQNMNSKDLIVQTVTEKLAKAQNEFKVLQRDLTRNLDHIQRLTEVFKTQATNQVKPLLETTIKKLDFAILKSEMMLLTDMQTEKRLMQASSQLAEAKKLLTKGNYQEANKIVQEVKNLIAKLEFKPSEIQVKHFITKEEQTLTSRTSSQQLLQQFDEMSQRRALQDPAARQIFEHVRQLGLNRDSEVAQMLASGKQNDGEANQNMKQALMQLMKMEDEQGRLSQQSNQALANITGQQLLSKSDNNNLQSMFLSLPFLLQDEVKNLQVFVNSRSEGQKVDWENCNLYFLIETKKLGEVGILVSSTDRNLSLTIKNDQPFFKERIEPLAAMCKEKLKDVGYNITSFTFAKLHQEKNQEKGISKVQQQQKITPTFTEKGFDFKI